jgi:hypothetical protein
MEVTFNVGPLLSGTTTNNTTLTVLMPQPSENNGVWSWMEQDPVTGEGSGLQWNSYPIMQTDEKANLSNVSPVLRTGMLTLSGAINE